MRRAVSQGRATPLPQRGVTVSVTVPVHNTRDYLAACLESLLVQTEPDIEVICVDDGSTDDSLLVLQHYTNNTPRVRVISHERNRGVSAARNTGIQAATGQYVAFVDSDDCPKPDFCQRLLAAARRVDADIAKGNYAYAQHDRIDYGINQKIREDKNNFFIQCCSAIFRTAFLKKHGLLFAEHLHASEDLLFAFQAAVLANTVAIDDEAHIEINTRPGSASFAAPDHRTVISHYQALDEILRTALEASINRASFNYVLASLFALFARICGRNRRPETRAFMAAENARLFSTARESGQLDPTLFTTALKEDGKLLYTCLEGNTLDAFFAHMDTMQAERCRLLRKRAQ